MLKCQDILRRNTLMFLHKPYKTEIIKMSYIYVLENMEIYTSTDRYKHELSNDAFHSFIC